jgi:hypothetical protein
MNGWKTGLESMEYEFFEGDTPQSMFGIFFKERCKKSEKTFCYPELTCSGNTGEPISGGLRTTYFPDSDYTFDALGCYFNSAVYPAIG